MNIAFFSKDLPSDAANGVSVQVHRLANELTRRGHAVTCFSFSPKPVDAAYQVNTLADRSRSRLARKFLPALKFRSIDTSAFDIVHYHGDDYLCKGSSRRVRTFYGSALGEALHAGRVGRGCYQALFYLFEWISCLKRGTLVGISASTKRALPLVNHQIPCGVPLEQYFPGNAKTAHPSILFVGDLQSRKRGALLARAFDREVRPRLADCTLTIVGPTPLSATGVISLGRVAESRLIAVMRESWAVCIPSSYEGFGVLAIEAMACGTAVVATDNAGLREIISDGSDGLLCRAATLGQTLNTALSDPLLRSRLVRQGLTTAATYSIKLTADGYERLYKVAAGKDRAA